MIYSQELVWKAVYIVLPTYELVREADLHVNLSDAIKSASIEFFMLDNATWATPTPPELVWAKSVVFDALHELRANGHMTFGTIDDFGDWK